MWPVVSLCITAALAAAGGPALRQGASDDTDAVRKQIQAVLDRADLAAAAKDWQGVASIDTSDFQSTDVLGVTTNRDQTLANLKQTFDKAARIKINASVEDVSETDTAVGALIRGDGSADLTGPDGKTHPVSWSQLSAELWSKTAAGWQTRAEVVVRQDVVMDGRPLLPEGRPGDDAVRQAIQAASDGYATALTSGDYGAIEKAIASGFTAIGPDGARLDRAQFLAGQRAQTDNRPPGLLVSITVDRLMVSGDLAATVRTLRAAFNTATAAGAVQRVLQTGISHDTWRKTAGGWQEVTSALLYTLATVGGKPQKPVYVLPAPAAAPAQSPAPQAKTSAPPAAGASPPGK